MVAFGEDVGSLGDVNQAFRGLQESMVLYVCPTLASVKPLSWVRPLA
jgi:hypothetical protein